MLPFSSKKWHTGLYDLPRRSGKLKADLSKFDAAYFGINPKQAHRMEPATRQLLMIVHEAIMDAGM